MIVVRAPIVVLLMMACLACGQPKAPGNEDACATDQDCASSLMCCHVTADAPSTAPARTNDRGFCVKQSVCANVAPPRQASPLDE